ncbi:MAG: hypothetical protein IIB09_01560 [Bacteroidetes bacterium]|nr:hypothetical protein [Bacteroidota bacterium]
MSLLIAIALILFGLVLLGLEIYLVPGVNVIGVIGVISVGVGVVYAFVTLGPLGGILALAGALLAGGGLVTYLWQTGAWDRLILADALNRDDLADAAEKDSRSRWLGEIGTAVTPLRPTGIVEVGGERLEVLTEGAFIAAGSHVKVVAMDRRRYFVRLAGEEEKEGAPGEAA